MLAHGLPKKIIIIGKGIDGYDRIIFFFLYFG